MFKLLHKLRIALWRRPQSHTLATLKQYFLVPLAVSLTGCTVAGLVLGVRHLGGLQGLELVAFDQMVRLRPPEATDPRILVVAITEADIQQERRWPLSDRTLAQALAQLQRHRPLVIGLDVWRDLPQEPGNLELLSQLKASNVIAIKKLGDAEDRGVAAPPGVPAERVGFNDVPLDPDGVIRRYLIFGSEGDTVYFSFGLQLAMAYLAQQGIQPQPSAVNPDYLKLGQATFLPLTTNSGGYQTIDARGYQLLLNYRASRDAVRQVSLAQVLTGQVDPAWVKDRIVLIGATARSAKDDFLTPYGTTDPRYPTSMAGVVLQAQAVSQILDAALGQRPLFGFWAEWMDGVWVVGWALAAAGVAWGIRRPIVLVAGSVGLIAGLVGTCFYLFSHQIWVPTATPVLAALLTTGVVVSGRAYQAQRQQQIVMTLLGQNTSPEIALALWNSRDRLIKSGKLPGQRVIATMLFTDIKNFSTISEQMQPESLLEWLNEYLSEITKEVKAHQGIINKFTGDGMMAVFGVPIHDSRPDQVAVDAIRAVSCALAMGERLARLNHGWKQRRLPQAQMRVGIFTGPVVVGSLGGKDRLEYGVIGDSVNIAARLESYEKDRQVEDCRVLIAQETLEYLQDQFQVEPWGMLALKGKQQPVDVYRVVGRNPASPSVEGGYGR